MPQTIGILGGLSPQSTANYYQSIVGQHFKFYGNQYYPRIIIASVCYQQYADWQRNNQWNVMAKNLEYEFAALANAGADFVLLACNTAHKALPLISSPIPILNIIDVAAWKAKHLLLNTLVLTGSQFTMSDSFLRQRLQSYDIDVVIPDTKGRTEIQRIIISELITGIVSPESAQKFTHIVQTTIKQQKSPVPIEDYGVLLACTELGMLLPYLPSEIRFLDTASLHATAAWKIATEQIAAPWD